MREIVAAIEAAAPESRGQITFNDQALQLPEDVDAAPLVGLIGEPPFTPLQDAVVETLGIFRAAVGDGRMAPDAMLEVV